jgi:excisionase family DNA binding protein
MADNLAPALLDYPAAQAYLDLGRTKLSELVARGELRPIRIGRSVRFPRLELEEFIERLRAEQRGDEAWGSAERRAR